MTGEAGLAGQEGVAACVPGFVMVNWSEEQLDQVEPPRLQPSTRFLRPSC